MKRILALFLLAVSAASAQPVPPAVQPLVVNSTTSAITGPGNATRFASANNLLRSSRTVYASQVAALTSNVLTGGGTDDTAALQTILNLASGGAVDLELVMDGAALVTGLRVYSNTTIRCLTQSCGFYLKAQSNVSVLRNATPSATVVTDKHIRLIGGTYNGNSANQTAGSSPDASGDANLHAIAFYGVDDVRVTGVSTYYGNFMAYMFSLWSNVWIENCENVNYTDAANDAFHFVGSGSYLTIKNVSGSCGADFIPLNSSDYKDTVGSSWVVRDGLIQHVLIDGVFLKNTRNGVGIVSGAIGAGCDDIVVRNVQGTCQNYAVSLWNPWSTSYDGGYIGTVILDGITAQSSFANGQVVAIFSETNGTGPTPGLNHIRNLVISNVAWDPTGNQRCWLLADSRARINSLTINGVAINEPTENVTNFPWAQFDGQADRVSISNFTWLRPSGAASNKAVFAVGSGASVGYISTTGVTTNLIAANVVNNGGTITLQYSTGINGATTGTQFVSTADSSTRALVIPNTLNIPNLNASLLNGTTFAAPGIIGGTTPSSATFTELTASGNATVGAKLNLTNTLNSTATNIGTLIVGNGTASVTGSIGGGNFNFGGSNFVLGSATQSGATISLGQDGNASGNSKTLNFATGGYAAPGTFGNTSTGEKIKFYRNGADTDVAMGVSATTGLWIKSQGNGSANALEIYATATNSGSAPLVWTMTKAGNITQTGSLSLPTSTPASAGATGVTGTITWDSSFVYVCTATNTWKRVAIATW